MADIAVSTGASRIGFYVPRLGLAAGIIALILLALAPIGWRTGLWHFRTSFYDLMEPAFFVGLGGLVISLIALFWWGSVGAGSRVTAIAGIIIGAVVAYYPFQFYAKIFPVPVLTQMGIFVPLPRIHDITTDTENPPVFSPTMLSLRAAEKANSVDYDPKVAAQQKKGYPDIAPVRTALPPAEAFKRALATAKSMSGWRIVTTDPAAGRIEASQSTLFMGFVDDVVIRVTPDATGSRIDVRSVSRMGISDFGVNAKRVRTYTAALSRTLG